MKKYKVSRNLWPYIRKILIRRVRRYKVIRENGEIFVQLTISNKEFHDIVKRALCEKETAESADGYVYITPEEEYKTNIIAQELNLDLSSGVAFIVKS